MFTGKSLTTERRYIIKHDAFANEVDSSMIKAIILLFVVISFIVDWPIVSALTPTIAVHYYLECYVIPISMSAANSLTLSAADFSIKTHQPISVQHLKVLSCDAYAHVPKDERRKPDAKAQRCVLLGYGTKTTGYRLFTVENDKVFFSRDVKLNESNLTKQPTELTEIKAAGCGKYTCELENTNRTYFLSHLCF